jgi:hypothetical protein
MYDKNTESMITFIIENDVKTELDYYCKSNDVTKSQVLRDTVKTWLDFIKQNDGGLTLQTVYKD